MAVHQALAQLRGGGQPGAAPVCFLNLADLPPAELHELFLVPFDDPGSDARRQTQSQIEIELVHPRRLWCSRADLRRLHERPAVHRERQEGIGGFRIRQRPRQRNLRLDRLGQGRFEARGQCRTLDDRRRADRGRTLQRPL